MICPVCHGQAVQRLIAGQFFILCVGDCAGASEGSPLTHGHAAAGNAINEYEEFCRKGGKK